MNPSPLLRRGATAGLCAGALVAALATVPVSAAVATEAMSTDGPYGEPILESLRAVPAVDGPIARDADSYPFSTMDRARVPVDLAAHGYVEEEYFLSGTANVYDNAGGRLSVVTEDVPYVNRILVRRPANRADSSGVVLVDILNASNGFDGEDHWRRLWQEALAEGHTVIGVTSKPIQVDALKNFDAERYDRLTWDVDDSPRVPILADPANPAGFNPFGVVPGAEEGLAWDIITQLGSLLDSHRAEEVLGGQRAETVLLLGQSQSGIYLNTWVSNFHDAAAQANDGNVYDAYLNTVGAVLERPLRQSAQGGFVTVPGSEPAIDAPFITVTSEGDAGLFGVATLAEKDLPANRRHWQVPGTPHTDLLSPVIPADEELYASGRLPNTAVHDPVFREALNPYPLEPAIVAAVDALVTWVQDGTPAAASQWFATADGALVRDEHGNALGGVRYGLIEHPLGQYLGASAPGSVFGSIDLIPVDEFTARYGSRSAYLRLMGAVDDQRIAQGYLTASGARQLRDVANLLMDRIGVPQTARSVAGLHADLEAYVAGGDVSGPIVQQLRNAMRQADRHLAADRAKPAVAALERALARLDRPKRGDHLTDSARADVTGQVRGLIDHLG